MFTRTESSRIRQEFWTTFGRYMSPVPSAEGMKINWVNYHTGVKDVYFRMDAGPRSSRISISLEHRDGNMRDLSFQRFETLRDVLHVAVGEVWEWKRHADNDSAREVASIFKEIKGVSVFNKNDWPALISFFKARIIALDSFWTDARYSFEGLDS